MISFLKQVKPVTTNRNHSISLSSFLLKTLDIERCYYMLVKQNRHWNTKNSPCPLSSISKRLSITWLLNWWGERGWNLEWNHGRQVISIWNGFPQINLYSECIRDRQVISIWPGVFANKSVYKETQGDRQVISFWMVLPRINLSKEEHHKEVYHHRCELLEFFLELFVFL